MAAIVAGFSFQTHKNQASGGAFNTNQRNFWIHGQEEGHYPSPNSPQPDLSCFPRRYQTQVHRHLIQVWAQALLDDPGEAEVLWPSQGLEGTLCAYSDSRGLPGIRKKVVEFIAKRDGYPWL